MKLASSPRVRRLTAAVALGAAAALLAPATADAAVSTQVATVISPTMTTAERAEALRLRALYFERLNLARANYTAARTMYTGMPSTYPVAFVAVVTKANSRIGATSTQLSAARTLTDYAIVGRKVNYELLLSKVHLKVVRLASDALKARTSAIAAGGTATRQLLAGQIDDQGYAPRAEASARVAALASADLVRMKAALGGSVYPAASQAAAWVPALDGSMTVPETPGYIAIPGSCALPVADAAWAGAATGPGPHQWVSAADLEAATTRLAQEDARYTAADVQFTRVATKVLATSLTAPSDLRLRAQRLGYLWLTKGNTSARSLLLSDTTRVLAAGPSGAQLTDAGVIEGAVTSLDWAEEPSGSMTRNATALRSMWLSPFSCLYADRIGLHEPHNVGIIYSSTMFQLGIYLARYDTALGAAVAKAAWTSMSPNFRVLADGGWYEGPAYRNLMGRALVGALSTARTVYGTAGPGVIPDLSATAKFQWNATTDTGDLPAFSDTTADRLRPMFPLWVAHTTPVAEAMPEVRDRLYGVDRVQPEIGEAYQILWWPSDDAWALPQPTRGAAVYPITGLSVVHAGNATAWLRGGPRYLAHTHLDVGTVSLAANGVQWTVDPGKGNYAAPSYFNVNPGSPRWSYFHVSPKSHSVVTGSSAPRLGALTPLTASGTTTSVDLRRTLPGTSTATRTVSLAPTSMTMVDSLAAATAQRWTWRWVTEATVSASGTTTTNPRFTLADAGKRLSLSVSGVPAGSVATVSPTTYTSATGRRITTITITTPLRTSTRFTSIARW